MATFPPPTITPDRSDRAARLDRLAQRQRTATDTPATGTPATAAAIDTRSARRKHPAKGARAAAFGMSLATTAGLAGVFATMRDPAPVETGAAIVATRPGPTMVWSNPAAPFHPSSSDAVTVAQTTVVNGAVFTNRWGPVQVEATFAADGSLIGVDALQTPDNRRTSVKINDRAVPRLTSDALRSQSADVDTVSGATYTSVGYRKSLQSAIDAARIAGVTTMA